MHARLLIVDPLGLDRVGALASCFQCDSDFSPVVFGETNAGSFKRQVTAVKRSTALDPGFAHVIE